MEHQGQHGHATNRVDEYGNPVAAHGAAGGQFQPAREEHKTGGILHRSGSSSSSSVRTSLSLSIRTTANIRTFVRCFSSLI